MPHPSLRFRAPGTITAGQPLKQLLDRRLVALLDEALAPQVAGWSPAVFRREALAGLDDLELMPRARHLAAVVARHLDPAPAVAARQLIASFGPPLAVTAGFGLAPFFYLPHVFVIADHLVADWDAGMAANYEVTRRFSAEFSIRPYLERAPGRTLARLAEWTADPCPHVRRLVSEGTRPRLPWAGRLAAFLRDPAPLLPLLDRLVDDPVPYVRRSVANHLGDIAKDHPALAFATARRWLAEAPTPQRRQVVRHAVRLPARQGVAEALALRRAAGGR